MKMTDVLRRPLITEKTTIIREDGRTLVFQVAMDANKIDIRRAVEHLLGARGICHSVSPVCALMQITPPSPVAQ